MQSNVVIILILIAVLNTPLLYLASEAQLASNNTSSNTRSAIGVFQPDSKPYGLTYENWTAKWWQWAYSIPKDAQLHTYTTQASTE